jgi:hypothetical protein
MKSRILMFFAIASMGFAGCSEPCDDVNCLNGGACNDGTCVCLDGFTGEYCQSTVNPDPCADVNCGNNGECVDGECVCDQGYYGVNCETEDLRTEVIGNYIVIDNCMPGHSYLISITANSASGLAIDVSNIGDHGFTVLATINEVQPYLFSFGAQSVTIDGNPATISGTGTAEGNSLYLNYTTLISGTSTNCNIN